MSTSTATVAQPIAMAAVVMFPFRFRALLRGGSAVAVRSLACARNAVGATEREGIQRTTAGRFVIARVNATPNFGSVS